MLLVSGTASATDYYVCNTGGSDANDGLTTSTPFETFSKARTTFTTMNAGDSVLLCRDGVFPAAGSGWLANFNCGAAAGQECTMSDYGAGTSRPIINVTSGHGLNFEEGGAPSADGGYIISNLIFKGISPVNSAAGIRFYNDVNDVMLQNLHIEGFNIGVHTAGAGGNPDPGADEEQNRITLKDSVIFNNTGQGWLGGCDNCIIEGNTFENNGFTTPVFDHNVYLASSGGQVVNNMIVRDNYLYKSTHSAGTCQGVSMVGHGMFDTLTIENNVIREDVGAVSPTCWGISIDPGYASEEYFLNISIINNTLINVGNVAIGCASCNGATITGNVIIDAGNQLSHGIAVPVRTEDTVKSQNVTISNNKIIGNTDTFTGVNVDGVNVFTVTNNEISRPDTSTVDCITRSGSNAAIDISTNTCYLQPSLSWP